jgi:hypothetical protein
MRSPWRRQTEVLGHVPAGIDRRRDALVGEQHEKSIES